ncbi:MAG: hypothetical protein AAGC67_13230 [Myxococcota bacterium]
MTQANEEKVATLLQQGLESYGTGDVARAFMLWNEVLELDPGNEEALDYMRDADRRSKPRGDSADGVVAIVEDARRLAHTENEEAALELLTSMATGGPIEGEAMIELLRARLFRHYQLQLGDLSQIPRVSGEGGDLQARNLPTSAGFLLSMVDGVTPLVDLMSVSGMDRFEALRSIHRMHQAGILEWD